MKFVVVCVVIVGALLRLQRVEGQDETAAVVPEPNLREGCTPRCANTADAGQYRCNVDDQGTEICNTFELTGEHTCHFHYYTQEEVVQCLVDERIDTVYFFGSSALQTVPVSVFPWMDFRYDMDLDYEQWAFEGRPRGKRDPMDDCLKLVLSDSESGVVDREASEYLTPACEGVLSRSQAERQAGVVSLVTVATVSPGMMHQQLDLLQAAGRLDDRAYVVIYVGYWYDLCITGKDNACNTFPSPESAEVRAFRGRGEEGRTAALSYFRDKYSAMLERLVEDMPNAVPVMVGVRRRGDFLNRMDDIIQELAAENEVLYLNLEGTAGLSSPNRPADILGHSPHIVNHAIFQRVVSQACKADEARDTECEEEVVGSNGCQTETYTPNPEGEAWWRHYNRGCRLSVFQSCAEDGQMADPSNPSTCPCSSSAWLPGSACSLSEQPVELCRYDCECCSRSNLNDDCSGDGCAFTASGECEDGARLPLVTMDQFCPSVYAPFNPRPDPPTTAAGDTLPPSPVPPSPTSTPREEGPEEEEEEEEGGEGGAGPSPAPSEATTTTTDESVAGDEDDNAEITPRGANGDPEGGAGRRLAPTAAASMAVALTCYLLLLPRGSYPGPS